MTAVGNGAHKVFMKSWNLIQMSSLPLGSSLTDPPRIFPNASTCLMLSW